jgi:hypothetical protein
MSADPDRKTPWHLWVVGILALLWNASGAYTIMMAQAGRLADVGPEEAAYYAAQPLWLFILTDIALFSGIAAALALLLRSRTAVWLFALSLAVIILGDIYDLAAGTSLILVAGNWLILTLVIVLIAILEYIYAWAMRGRMVLR